MKLSFEGGPPLTNARYPTDLARHETDEIGGGTGDMTFGHVYGSDGSF